MDRDVSVRTPESIAFTYELAGLGSRFLAVIADMVLQTIVLFAIFFGLAFAGRDAHPARTDGVVTSIAEALIAFIVFAVFFGYFIVFETLWSGRTPGKKLLGLRVVRDGGYPLDFAAAAVRNLIRIAEVALGFYTISAIVSLCSAANKRLGDYAAGTIVVRDSAVERLSVVLDRTSAEPRPAMLTPHEHEMIDRFLTRRARLAPHTRAVLAMQIADRVRPRVSADLQRLDDEELLTRLSGS